jgi:hypothetical protein
MPMCSQLIIPTDWGEVVSKGLRDWKGSIFKQLSAS